MRGIASTGGWRAVVACGALLASLSAGAQQAEPGQVQLDFNDVELSVVIDTIAQLTGTNFIYDDKVRGRVTVISPAPMSRDQAYAVFESILQVKGFTTVKTPGGVVKIIPIREAKESSVETLQGRQATPDRDRFVTRLIPLRYIDAEAIANTLKPLVSKEASMVSYAPTNTIILTDSATNIRRLLGILDAIDVETYKEHLAVLKVHHGDAATLAQQLSEIYGAEASTIRELVRSSVRIRTWPDWPLEEALAAAAAFVRRRAAAVVRRVVVLVVLVSAP